MVSAKQRAFMYRQVRKFWESKLVFTLDFWNDGEYSQGCLAAGKRALDGGNIHSHPAAAGI